MLTSILKLNGVKVALSLLAVLSVTSCHHETTEPVPTTPLVATADRPTDFKGWMKLHQNELTSARLAYQTAKAKHILPGQRFDRNAFDADYKTALQDQGMAVKQLPSSVRVPENWNPTGQTTAQYLDAHQVKGALKQYILTLEQNLKKAADKLLRERNNSAARSAADDDWGPSEEQTLREASTQLHHSAMSASASGISYEETEVIWMVTGMVMNFLPEFMHMTKQELGFYNGIDNIFDGQAVQNSLGPKLGRLLRRLFNVVTTIVIQAAVLLIATVLALSATLSAAVTPGAQIFIPYINTLYNAVAGALVVGMYNAVAGNSYICSFHDDGGRC